MYPDHLEVTVSGVPRLNVTMEEVGLSGGGSFGGLVSEGRPAESATRTGGFHQLWPGRELMPKASCCLLEEGAGVMRREPLLPRRGDPGEVRGGKGLPSRFDPP